MSTQSPYDGAPISARALEQEAQEASTRKKPLVVFQAEKTAQAGLYIVGGVCRGASTTFYWSVTDNTLYFSGENPSEESDGMVINPPWSQADELDEVEGLDVEEAIEVPQWVTEGPDVE